MNNMNTSFDPRDLIEDDDEKLNNSSSDGFYFGKKNEEKNISADDVYSSSLESNIKVENDIGFDNNNDIISGNIDLDNQNGSEAIEEQSVKKKKKKKRNKEQIKLLIIMGISLIVFIVGMIILFSSL